MKGKGKGFLVKWDGKHGIAFHKDQKKTFRCPCCSHKVSKEGKALITPTDKYGEIKEDKRKVIVRQEKLNVVGFID